MTNIDILAVLAAAVASFAFGALWYSPLLMMKAWCREAGVDPNMQVANPGKVYGLTFVMTLISALAMAWLLGPHPGLIVGILVGAVVGVALVATSMFINYQFATRSLLHWAIDGGFHVCRFIVMGAVLGTLS